MTVSLNDLESLETGRISALITMAVKVLTARLAEGDADLAALDLVSTTEAARIIGVSPQMVRRWCHEDKITHVLNGDGTHSIPRAIALAAKADRQPILRKATKTTRSAA